MNFEQNKKLTDMAYYRSGMEIGKQKSEIEYKQAVDSLVKEDKEILNLQRKLKKEKKNLKIKVCQYLTLRPFDCQNSIFSL